MGMLLIILGSAWAALGAYMLLDQPWMAFVNAIQNSTFPDPMRDPAVIAASNHVPFVLEPILLMILPGIIVLALGVILRRQSRQGREVPHSR